jgi:predicted homoserine dehydrogenase-like protein
LFRTSPAWLSIGRYTERQTKAGTMIYQHLFERVKRRGPVRAGIVGTGEFGTTIVTQSPIIPRLQVPIVADLDIEAGRSAYLKAGYAPDDIAVCDSRGASLRAMEAGKVVVVQDAMILMDLPIDVVATATRSPEAGACCAYEAIRHGKHVVMVDKEADSVVGPVLKHVADRAGVVFTTDDGDEPGLVMGLVSWARTLGLEVLSGGNVHHCLYDPEAATVTSRSQTVQVPDKDRWALGRIPEGKAERYVQARRRLFAPFRPSEECGDPMAHMAVAANGTGLLPDAPVGHRTVARLVELADVFCPAEDGGILRTRGAIDIPAILHTADQPHGGGGVFVVVGNADRHSREVMIRKGLYANYAKTAMLIYRPYHLCGAETAMSILCAGLLEIPTGSSEILPRVDIIATTARDFAAGETLGEPGTLGWNQDLRAALAPGAPMADDKPLPFFMLEGNKLAVDVPAGMVITKDMVVLPKDSVLWHLRQQQDEHFFGSGLDPQASVQGRPDPRNWQDRQSTKRGRG